MRPTFAALALMGTLAVVPGEAFAQGQGQSGGIAPGATATLPAPQPATPAPAEVTRADPAAPVVTAPASPGVTTPAAPPPTASVGPAVIAPATPSPAATARTEPAGARTDERTGADVPTTTTPQAGANSFTQGQARSRIEAAGYADVSELRLDEQGVWRGRGMREGSSVEVGLDFRGNVVTGGAPAATTR